MQFFKRNILSLCTLTVLVVFGMCGDALAGGDSIVKVATDKVGNVFKAVKTITFILGGFGLVGIAYQAILGKVKWSWFAGLAVGLAILAAAGSIVEYATGSTEATTGDSGLETTFGNM